MKKNLCIILVLILMAFPITQYASYSGSSISEETGIGDDDYFFWE